jgi:hypothetical protein
MPVRRRLRARADSCHAGPTRMSLFRVLKGEKAPGSPGAERVSSCPVEDRTGTVRKRRASSARAWRVGLTTGRRSEGEINPPGNVGRTEFVESGPEGPTSRTTRSVGNGIPRPARALPLPDL